MYDDAETGQPAWLAIKTGLFGMNRSFVPADKAEARGDTLVLPFDKQQVKDAPNIAPDYQLTHDEERAMYQHYGLKYKPWSGTDYDTSTGYADQATVETETMTASSEQPVDPHFLPLHRHLLDPPVLAHIEQRQEKVRLERESGGEITSSERRRDR